MAVFSTVANSNSQGRPLPRFVVLHRENRGPTRRQRVLTYFGASYCSIIGIVSRHDDVAAAVDTGDCCVGVGFFVAPFGAGDVAQFFGSEMDLDEHSFTTD